MTIFNAKNPKLALLRHTEPDRARKLVLEALTETEGAVSRAAKLLKMGRRTLHRWIEEDKQLERALQRIRKARVA